MNHAVVNQVKMEKYAPVLIDAYDEFFEVDLADRCFRPIFLTSEKSVITGQDTGVQISEVTERYIHEEDRRSFQHLFCRESLEEVCAKGARKRVEFRRRWADGQYDWVRGTLFSPKECGQDKALFYTVDIGREKDAAGLLQMNRDLFGVFLDAYMGIAVLDLVHETGTIIQYNPMPQLALRSYGWDHLMEYLCGSVIYPGDRKIFSDTFSISHMRGVWRGGQRSLSLEVRYSEGGEGVRWAQVNAMLFSGEGEADKVYLAMQDVNEQHLLKGIVERYVYSNCDYFIYLDARNNSYVMFSGKENGMPLPPDRGSDYEREFEIYIRKYVMQEDQELAAREIKVGRVLEELDRKGEHSFYCGVIDPGRGYTRKRLKFLYYDRESQMVLMTRTDVTDIYMEQKRQNRLLQNALLRAQTDPLTGLYNQAVKEIMARRLEDEEGLAALLFMDLDNFKVINDTLGHMKGDLMLQEVAGVLKKTLRAADISGRVGGDEFIALLHPVGSQAGVRQCAQRICASVRNVMDRDFQDFSITCSIGIAMYPDNGREVQELVEKADKAAYAVKRKGKNGFAFYSDLL